MRMMALMVMAIAPVNGEVVRSYDAPDCDRCSGHRGVTIASTPGTTVRSPLAGVVTFAGSVGARLYVVVLVRQNVRVTVGHVAAVAPGVSSGVAVQQGAELAVAAATTYLSVRQGDIHREPLRALGLGRARLVGGGGLSGANVGHNGAAR